jgi:hypothetical protein
VVGEVERDKLGLLRDAGIARRALEVRRQRASRDRPGQRVLAAAGAEEKDVHMLYYAMCDGLENRDSYGCIYTKLAQVCPWIFISNLPCLLIL